MAKNTNSDQKVNVPSRTIFNKDNLDILKGINSNCIDLIYLDPPFNKKKVFTAPIGSSAEGAEFSDIFKEEDIKDEWVSEIEAVNEKMSGYLKSVREFGNRYNYCYLVYMAIRLLQCHRILKDTGSIYLHCDPTMSHYLKLLMDMIFDEKNFRNEIIWGYTGPGSPKMRQFNRKHDVVFWYSKGTKWIFNADAVRLPHSGGKPHVGGFVEKDGRAMDEEMTKEYGSKGKIPETWWVQNEGNGLAIAARQKKQYTGYPTQKPLALLERIVKASSNEGDMVLDPFCGCATTCVVAERLNRQWIGIDVSVKAYELVQERLKKATEQGELLSSETKIPKIFHKVDVPKRTDTGNEFADKQGWVYIITNKQFELIKVGITKDVKRRLDSYQTSDPKRGYEIAFEFQSPKYIEIENHIKERFTRDHEWFRREDMDDIITAIKTFVH